MNMKICQKTQNRRIWLFLCYSTKKRYIAKQRKQI